MRSEGLREKIKSDQQIWSEGKTPSDNRPFKVAFEKPAVRR